MHNQSMEVVSVYVLKLMDLSARKKAILIKLKSNSMEQLSDCLKKFVDEKNGTGKEVKKDGKI